MSAKIDVVGGRDKEEVSLSAATLLWVPVRCAAWCIGKEKSLSGALTTAGEGEKEVRLFTNDGWKLLPNRDAAAMAAAVSPMPHFGLTEVDCDWVTMYVLRVPSHSPLSEAE